MGCEVASAYVAPTDGGYKRPGHVHAYHRGYSDGRRGYTWPGFAGREKPGHRAAYRAGSVLGSLDREGGLNAGG